MLARNLVNPRPPSRSRGSTRQLHGCTPRGGSGVWAALALLMGLTLLAGVAEAAMTFIPTNVEQASLYQTVQLNLNSNPLQQDPRLTVGDSVYFLNAASASLATDCVYVDPAGGGGAGLPVLTNVTVADATGFTGQLTVAIVDGSFTVGQSYVACYLSNSLRSATLMRRQTFTAGAPTSLLVWPPLYSGFTLAPASPSGGEGPVNLTLPQVAQTGRSANEGLTGSYTVFLAPCTSAASCADANALTTVCATLGAALITAPMTVSGVVELLNLRWTAPAPAPVVVGDFTVPYAPGAFGYAVCVPYCYSATAGCSAGGGGNVAMSYTVVASASGAQPTLARFAAANPGTYTSTPTAPQARELGTMRFTGTGLSANDVVKVVGRTQSCTSAAASLLGNLQVGPVVMAGPSAASVEFTAPDLVDGQVVGKVCYWRADTGLWSTAYRSASNPVADFTIDVLQPTSLTVVPASPTIGQSLTIFFTGTGLNGATDAAFLSASQATDPCASTTADDGVFPCNMTGGTAPSCTATVDPVGVDQGLTLAVCYRKSGGLPPAAPNFAQLRDAVSLGPRNPTYAASPYPMFAGQTVSLIFTGEGLSSSDVVQLVPRDGVCGVASPVTTATLQLVGEVQAGVAYNYSIVGAGELCLKVCYRFVGTTAWISTQAVPPTTAVVPSCPAQALYIAPYPLRYSTGLPSGSPAVARETLRVGFSSVVGAVGGRPLAVKVVRAGADCVLAPCTWTDPTTSTTAATAACARTADAQDYVGAITGAGQVPVMLAATGVSYVVCVLDAASGSAFIPVQESATGTYVVTTAAANAVLSAQWPPTWHVAMASLNATFTGSGLDASADMVYPLLGTAMLATAPTPVCPAAGTTPTPTTALIAALVAGGSAVSTQATLLRADRLTAGAQVFLCYQWSTPAAAAGEGAATLRMSYAGAVTFAAAVPSRLTPGNVPPAGFYRAGDPVTLDFANALSGTAPLSPTADEVFFYRYDLTANPNPGCYCDASQCTTGTLVRYPQARLSAGAQGAAASVTYANPRGFDNYGANATYVVCYTVASLDRSATFMGQITVVLANPSYYTVSSTAGTVNRVGAPLTVTARGCLGTSCAPLTAADTLLLIPAATQCADVTAPASAGDAVERIGPVSVAAGGRALSQRFAVNIMGDYRVCYRAGGGGAATFHELGFSAAFSRALLQVVEADPIAFTVAPAAPTAGVFTTVDLTCSAAVCAACATLRLLVGTGTSCWAEAAGYTSANCLRTTAIQFPDQYMAAGVYTVCYGSANATSRRLPGTLTINPANPSAFTTDPANVRDVYTNQATDFVLSVTGTGLLATDEIFLMPARGFSCHDLRTGELQRNGTLARWMAPSTNPYPLTVTATGVRWVASNRDRRFGAGMLADPTLCDGAGVYCTMKLCYRRSGSTWGPVALSDGAAVRLVASNPSSASFDTYPFVLDGYAMVTVAGSGLRATDTLAVHGGAGCTGVPVTALVSHTQSGSGLVNAAGTEWVGVVRFNNSGFATYSVCYWRDGGATEVVSVLWPGQAASVLQIVSTPLYFTLSAVNFTVTQATYALTQYQEAFVVATFSDAGTQSTPLTLAQMIVSDTAVAECNYEAFLALAARAGVTATRYPVVETLTPVPNTSGGVHSARLVEPAATYALCMMSSVGLFRVVSAPPRAGGGPAPALVAAAIGAGLRSQPVRQATATTSDFAIQPVNPARYGAAPAQPAVGQRVRLTFAVSTEAMIPSGTATAPAALQVGDVVQVIDGSLYECGFGNATVVVAQGLVSAINATDGSATCTLNLPTPSTTAGAGAVPNYEGRRLTVCYARTGGTFATVPRAAADGAAVVVDRNLLIAPQIPQQWRSQPTQLQAGAPANVTFLGNASLPTFLSATDTASLVSWPQSESAAPTTAACESRQPVVTSAGVRMDGINTVWQIPTGSLSEGRYVLCYTATANGSPVYVASPAFLTVYPPQSPTGAYTLGGGLRTFRGQRTYVLFNTTELLNVVLDDGLTPAAALAGRDVVTISARADCTNPLRADAVAAIPSSFDYADLGLTTRTPSGAVIPVPYVMLRMRAAAGVYYVCMQRANRESWQAYATPSVVGGAVSPAVLTVDEAPVTAFTTTPARPRAWVPQTSVTLTFRPGFTAVSIARAFFVPFPGPPGSLTGSNEVLYDNCYRPATAAEAGSANATLVNTTLSVDMATMTLPRAFAEAGTYLLCYELTAGQIGGDENHTYIASVFPSSLTVGNASPISYAVPTVLATGLGFSMTFTATDSIFAPATNANQATIYWLQNESDVDSAVPPSCEGATPPRGGGTTTFPRTSLTIASGVQASVRPLINQAAYFFVCFLTYDQTHAFAVPNAAGGFAFSVGLTGAMRYTVQPSPGYLGQVLNLTIYGNELSARDRAKIVKVSDAIPDPSSSLSLSTSASGGRPDYTTSCTAAAVNADASQPAGSTTGSAVESNPAGLLARYRPRVNATGTFILCYQSAALAGVWRWVPDVPVFTVRSAHPTSYELRPDPVYETQVDRLMVRDTAGLLGPNDLVKLVAAPATSTGPAGFVCTTQAAQSGSVGVVAYVPGESSATVSAYRVCASAAVRVVVCYQLAGSGGAWAEVPRLSPPPTYLYEPVGFRADPFTGPTLLARGGGARTRPPRPYEPFNFTFTSTTAGLAVTFVGFSLAPRQVCALDVNYVTPLAYAPLGGAAVSSTFTATLAAAGEYVLHLGMSANVRDPNITHATPLTVGSCDPCTVTPPYTFLGQTVTLVFPSGQVGGGSLSTTDELRIVPASVGLMGSPCDSLLGPYGGQTFTPVSVAQGGGSASFSVSAGSASESAAYIGEYLLCYRKATDDSFAVVADNAGTVAFFAIYPVDVVTVADMCPDGDGNVFALETVTFNMTVRNATLDPNTAFRAGDVFVLVPVVAAAAPAPSSSSTATVVTCENFDRTATGARAPVPGTPDRLGPGVSDWLVTLPATGRPTSYLACYRMEYARTFRSVLPPSPGSVATGGEGTLRAGPEDPYALSTTPPVLLPSSPNARITVTGTALTANDQVYVVPAGTVCSETCERPISPVEWSGVAFTKQFINATTVHIDFSAPINQVLTLSVCYRRAGRYLTTLGSVHVGEPNPTAWAVNFVPRLGTRPTVTFTGANLTQADRAMLVPVGATCVERNAVVMGVFVSVAAATGLSSSFNMTLLGDEVVAGRNYTVCYQVSSVGGYVVVGGGDALTVMPGGPAAFAVSNTPMRGRAFDLSFDLSTYPAQLGDEAYLTCPTCSCFDSVTPVTVAYGSAYGQIPNTGAGGVPTSPLTLRMGLGIAEPDAASTFPVCYRIMDSGFAQVGGLARYLTLTTSAPAAVAYAPQPTYQGQRVDYNFTRFTAAVPGRAGDEVMVVAGARLCWENETRQPGNILLAPTTIRELLAGAGDAAAAVARWRGHIPSLGPDTPRNLSFPAMYLLCYREQGQGEFVSVPYPFVNATLNAADPADFATTPATMEAGMIGIAVSFTGASVAGDEAYAVRFTTLTNTVCDDAGVSILSPRATAFPRYNLSLPGDAPLGTGNAALCYVKAGATVAEVPRLLTIQEGNPRGYTTNATSPATARSRQYLAFTIHGTGLDPAVDTVAFTEVPCAQAGPPPLPSTPLLARRGELRAPVADGTQVTLVVQFIAVTTPTTVYLCYSRAGVWREVGSPLVLEAPQPSAASFYTASGTPAVTPRAGQRLFLELAGAAGTAGTPMLASVLSGGVGVGTWCHNFTTADVTEPGLRITSPVMLSVPVWQTVGAARLCLMTDASTPWADVGATTTAALLPQVQSPNPLSMTVFPSPPRVGQRVTLTFHLVVAASAGDVVKITEPDDATSCEEAASIAIFAPGTVPVTVVDNATTAVTLTDATDPLRYRSFNETGDVRVCYWTAAESAWAVVGGRLAAGTVTVAERAPQSWRVRSGATVLGRNFSLEFTDALGVLNAERDQAWAAPEGQNCTLNPARDPCPGCMLLTLDPTSSSATSVVTVANRTVTLGTMNVCYMLGGATAALVPGNLTIVNGPIECVEEGTVVMGQQQTVTFRIREGTDTSQDAWRVSFYATTSRSCESNYVPGFLPGMATRIASTATNVSYQVVWPIALDAERYTLCYTHNGEVGPICTCDQVDRRTGECFVTTMRGSPASYTPRPNPSYVGQAITLDFAIAPDRVAYPPTAVKLVAYVDPLTTCAQAPAFTPSTGTTPTRVSDLEYTYTFKHDYLLGTSHLLVCALTNLVPGEYVQVASTLRLDNTTIVTEGDANLLWIRPYMTLSTVPANAAFLRAMQTLDLNFTHQSTYADDVVTLGDTFAFVTNPTECVESVIDAQDPARVMAMFELGDTAFVTVPAPVLAIAAAQRSARTIATFGANAASGAIGTHALCYRLSAGTWAPVLPLLPIGPALTDQCAYVNPTSPENSADASLRAMQYIRTTITGSSALTGLADPSVDEVRVVPMSAMCVDDRAVVYTGTTAAPAPPTTPPTIDTIAFAPAAGSYKLCYRFGGSQQNVTNWSPACVNLTVTAATPLADYTGCLNQGQTLGVDAAHRAGFVFAATDRIRYVAGREPCLLPNGTATNPLTSVLLNDTPQSLGLGFPLGTTAAGQASVTLPATLLGAGVTAVRLCYRDAAGNEFAVPLDAANAPTVAQVAVRPRQPASLVTDRRVQMGQRLRLTFTAAAGAQVRPWLLPYAPVPTPLLPGPAFDGTSDGASLWPLGSIPGVYREGRCAAALRAAAAAGDPSLGPDLRKVYGNVSSPATGGATNVTVGVYDPTAAQYHIACYRLATCGVADVGTPIRVLPYNPARVTTEVPSPRRGQLVPVLFFRDETTSDAAPLTPGSDRGAKVAGLASCWTLAADAGSVVVGTAEQTSFTAFFPAQPPASATPSTPTRSCYRLVGGSWSEVPDGGVAPVLAANPSSFATTPARARVDQGNTLTFTGVGLGAGDRVKVIPLSLNCSEAAEPAAGIVVYDAAGAGSPGTSAGWPIAVSSRDGTSAAVNLSATTVGTYSVCYRLAADVVWTLVYDNLRILERNPASAAQTPVSTLEGELFTLNFTASTAEGGAALSARDRVALYLGNDVSCVDPGDTPVIVTAASNADHLPGSLAFQMDAGTRGNHTVCYLTFVGQGVYTPVWGFAPVTIAPNPLRMYVFPVGDGRVQELVSLVFEGWGLVSDPQTGKQDRVKLIAATAPFTDAACRSEPSVADLFFYPLLANGTHAVQVVRAQTAPGQYWACYRLNGGQYHVMGREGAAVAGAAVSITEAASPSGATSPKLGLPVANGEAMVWTLTGAPAPCTSRDVLFYSASLCNDVPYYVGAASSWVSSAATSFPLGAAQVNCSAGATQTVRVSATATSAGAAGMTLSLCYLRTTDAAPTVRVVANDTVTVIPGVPPPLPSPVLVQAQAIFSVDLAVLPGDTDYARLVRDPDACQGSTAPPETATASLFMRAVYNATSGRLRLTTAVAEAGTYFLCYAHQVGACAPELGRDCARVIGTVVAAAASPAGWAQTPTPVYTSASLAVTFTGRTDTRAEVWMGVLPTAPTRASLAADTASMADVATVCLAGPPAASATAAYPLTYSAATGAWESGMLNVSGRYALCYRLPATATAAATTMIFAPITSAGPTVLPSNVTSIRFPTSPLVGGSTSVLLEGGGLSRDDFLAAVAVSAATRSPIPADICSGSSAYTPRVVAPVAATGGYGAAVSVRSLAFTQSGTYVLCYLPTTLVSAAGGATTSARRITPQPFAVKPRVTDVTVLGGEQLVAAPLSLLFTGSGLQVSDVAALVYVGDLPQDNVTAATACTPAAVALVGGYARMRTASADGTSATLTTTPMVVGDHMVCFGMTDAPEDPTLLPTHIDVREQTAVRAGFTVQPGGCQSLLVCSAQPSVTLFNATGQPTTSPAATVALHLVDATTGAAIPDGVMTGTSLYTFTNSMRFDFLALRISTPGSYVMVATVTLAGGSSTLEARSAAFTVVDSGGSGSGGPSPVQSLASVACTPVGILASSTSPVTCTVTTLSTTTRPDNYTVQLNAGTATACVAISDDPATGLPRCNFTVTPPPTTAAVAVNYLAIAVEPAAPYESWPVEHSPVIVRVPHEPDAATQLTCAPAPTPDGGGAGAGEDGFVRVGARLVCTVQGRALINGALVNIIAPPSSLDVRVTYLNLSGAVVSSRPVDLGPYPADYVRGAYEFTVTVAAGITLQVRGLVRVAGAEGQEVAMTGSPVAYTILGTPAAGATQMACTSTLTGSARWYAAQEAMACTVSLANSSGAAVNVIGRELAVWMPQGGSATVLNPAAAASVVRLAAVAPVSGTAPRARLARTWAAEVLTTTLARVRRATVGSSTFDYTFTLQVSFTPDRGAPVPLTTYTGNLVYVSAFAGGTVPALVRGRQAAVGLVGSGLDTEHRYVVAETTACAMEAAGAPVVEATAVAGPTLGSVTLTFAVPSNATSLYLCFAPADARAVLQRLYSNALPTGTDGGGAGAWTTDDLVLLILGIVLLVLLLILLIILLVRLCCGGRGIDRYAREGAVRRGGRHGAAAPPVPLPPRANDRFLYHPGNALAAPPPPPPPLPPLPLPPPPAPATTDTTAVRINIQDSVSPPLATTHPSAAETGAATDAPATSTRHRRGHHRSSSGSGSGSTRGRSGRRHSASSGHRSGSTARTMPSAVGVSPGYTDLDGVHAAGPGGHRDGEGGTRRSRPASLPPLPAPPAASRREDETHSTPPLRTPSPYTTPPPPPPPPPVAGGAADCHARGSTTASSSGSSGSSGGHTQTGCSSGQTPSGRYTPAPAPPPQPQQSVTPAPATGGSDAAREEGSQPFTGAGPFLVPGHTSRPMVRSTSRSSSVRQDGGPTAR